MRAVLYDRAGLRVDVVARGDGDIVIEGQDLSGASEYEYVITVRRDQVPKLVAALGGSPGQDVLALLRAQGEEIVKHGERTWLQEHGVAFELWTWFDPEL